MFKRVLKFTLSLTLALGVVGVNSKEVKANQINYNYDMNCSNYEVDVIGNNGSITNNGCFANFKEAKDKMNSLGKDAVVRHGSSKSPTKIIAMVSGTAYSYGYRVGANTINITQSNYNQPNQKKTYVTMHREMHYLGTESYDGNGHGSVHINLTGFEGYTDLVGVDLIPTIYTEQAIPIMLGGNCTGKYTEEPFVTHIYQMEYEVNENRELVFKWYSGWSGPSTYPDVNSHILGPAADWMNTKQKYYSYDGHTFYNDKYYTNFAGVYYNYYQFLPLRTKSNISAQVFDNYLVSKIGNSNSKMRDQGQTFVDAQNKYGVNALLVYAMACLESNFGRSTYALERNNLFGWSAFDSSPDSATTFPSIKQAVDEHMGINLRGFLDINDSRFFGMHLGNKGAGLNLKYAGDPYWGYKIAAIAYEIDKFANGNSGRLSDCNQYALGVINTYGINIKARPYDSSSTLYNSKYGATYQKDFIVTLLAEDGEYYKTNTTNPLNGETIISGRDKGLVEYNFNNHVGYISKAYIEKLNAATINQETSNKPTGDFVFSVDSLSWNNDKLAISGSAYRPGIYGSDDNKVTHTLNVYNEFFEETSYPLNTNLNNDIATFSSDIDVSSLKEGTYKFELNTQYARYSEYNQNRNITSVNSLPAEKVVNDKKISFVQDDDSLEMVVVKYVAPAPKPEVTPTPQPEKPQSQQKLVQSIMTFDFTDDNKLLIAGDAFIKGKDSVNADDVKHELVFVNSETNEEVKSYVATTKQNKINLGDGYSYNYTRFESEVDINELLELGVSNYTILIKVTNGETVMSDNLLNTEWLPIPSVRKIGENNVYFISNQAYRFRFELLINDIPLEWNTIKKANLRNSLFSKINLSIDDDENMVLDGASWIYNINYDDPSKVSYNLMLVNDKDGSVYKFDTVNGNKCEINYSKLLKLSYDYSNACFKTNNSLKDIPSGKYIMFIEIFNGEYHDIFEVTDYYEEMKLDVTSKNANRSFSFSKSSVRDRVELTITELN